MDITNEMIGKSTVKLTVEAPDAIKEKLSGEFILEMAKQLTREIERAMSIEGLPESNIELKLVFDPQTFMEHTSENVTYRRLLLTDKACGVKDFWVKWTRNNGAVAFSMCDAPAEGEITFELGEDVTQKVREKEYRFLVRSDTNKYHYAMGRKNITEWREMIKRAIKRGDLTRVVSELEVADHSSDVHDKLSSLLSSFGMSTPKVEEVVPDTNENSEFEEALRKAQEAVFNHYSSEEEPEEQSAPDVPFDFSAVVDDGEPEVDFSATEDEPDEDSEEEAEAEEVSDEEIDDLAAEDGADDSELDEALEDEPEEEEELEEDFEDEVEEELEEDSEDEVEEEEELEEDSEDEVEEEEELEEETAVEVEEEAEEDSVESAQTEESIIAAAQAQVRYEYENEARLRAEAECESLRAELKAMKEELDSAKRENVILTSENQRLKLIAESLAEQKSRLEAEKAEEERRLREEIDARIKAENRERERLEEAARLAVIEQRRIEEEKAEAERREEEARRIAEENARREEEAKRLEEEREREAERIRRETEIARGNITEEIPEKSSAVINAVDSDYTYVSRKVKLLFKNIVDPNITARIYEIIKTTVEYYKKESVSIRIKATVPDEKTVVLDFLKIPEEEGELFVNIIKVLGNSNLGITKAIVD